LLRRSAPRNDVGAHPRDLAACFARGLAGSFRPPFRGRRECRAPDAPDSRVCEGRKRKAHALVRSHRNHPAFPAQWFYGLFRALPGDRAFLPPSFRGNCVPPNLMPASGHQDHTTSPSASAPFVKGASTSTASRPASVTIASRPSCRGGTGRIRKGDLPDGESRKFFAKGLDTKFAGQPVGQIRCARSL
jgi:hypothetical protein